MERKFAEQCVCRLEECRRGVTNRCKWHLWGQDCLFIKKADFLCMFVNKAIYVAGYLQPNWVSSKPMKGRHSLEGAATRIFDLYLPHFYVFLSFPHTHPIPAPLHEIWTDCSFTITHFLVHTGMKKSGEGCILSARFFTAVYNSLGAALQLLTLYTRTPAYRPRRLRI